MSSRKIKYILLPVLALFVLAIIFQNLISADSNSREFISAKNVSAKITGKEEKFSIEKYKTGEDYQYFLTKNSLFSQKKKIKLSGFEDNISICGKESGVDNAICLIGDVGVHSQNIELIKYSGGNFSVLPFFRDGTSNNNITSDVPRYDFLNKDGNTFLIVDQRDYEKDPISQAIRDSYKSTESGLNFDGAENITYNNSR
ncbi:MAG: hypothetical protein M1324_01325 [Patescibacteria group bacterium]|nr:hypothetical protein [Patescibacteria group bacterium]